MKVWYTIIKARLRELYKAKTFNIPLLTHKKETDYKGRFPDRP